MPPTLPTLAAGNTRIRAVARWKDGPPPPQKYTFWICIRILYFKLNTTRNCIEFEKTHNSTVITDTSGIITLLVNVMTMELFPWFNTLRCIIRETHHNYPNSQQRTLSVMVQHPAKMQSSMHKFIF